MSENFTINISGIKSDFVNTFVNKHNNNIDISLNHQKDTLQLNIPKSIDEQFFMQTLNEFINNFKDSNCKELSPLWFFDEINALIHGPNQRFILKAKELMFLKALLKNNRSITYDIMTAILWEENKRVSQNAIRVFIKDIRKKLPPNTLKNVQGIGYNLLTVNL